MTLCFVPGLFPFPRFVFPPKVYVFWRVFVLVSLLSMIQSRYFFFALLCYTDFCFTWNKGMNILGLWNVMRGDRCDVEIV